MYLFFWEFTQYCEFDIASIEKYEDNHLTGLENKQGAKVTNHTFTPCPIKTGQSQIRLRHRSEIPNR